MMIRKVRQIPTLYKAVNKLTGEEYDRDTIDRYMHECASCSKEWSGCCGNINRCANCGGGIEDLQTVYGFSLCCEDSKPEDIELFQDTGTVWGEEELFFGDVVYWPHAAYSMRDGDPNKNMLYYITMGIEDWSIVLRAYDALEDDKDFCSLAYLSQCETELFILGNVYTPREDIMSALDGVKSERGE